MKAKRVYDFRGYTGPDVSMEVSLHEYGIAWKYNKKDKDYTFVYGVSMGKTEWSDYGYNLFAYAHMSYKDFLSMLNEEWFNLANFLYFIGTDCTVDGILPDDFPSYVVDAIVYHGTEKVFGTCYHEGFEIKGRY